MSESHFDLPSYLASKRAQVEEGFASYLATRLGDAPAELVKAVRYSLETPGKRLRPILVLASCEVVGGGEADALGAALAIEMIHTYSLIHDDLPCMDDDDLRRGRPTSHKMFGEALAILAGDGLITEALSLLATPPSSKRVCSETVLTVVCEVAAAAGVAGMVGGQVTDMVSEGRAVDQAALERLHAMKTGALIEVATRTGARLGGGAPDEIEALASYGRKLGLAFQITDDVLDVTASTEMLGKRSAKDGARGKTTFPALLGVEGSRARARALSMEASADVARFGLAAAPLVALARFVVERER